MSFDQVARFAATGMLNSLVAGLLVAAIAWLAVRLLDHYGAAVRFAVWLIALFSIVLLIGGGSHVTASYRVSPSPSASAVTLPTQVAWYLFATWIVGALLGLLRVVYSLLRLRRLRATCVSVEVSRISPQIAAALNEIVPHREVSVCESEAVQVPAALGYFRPMVVFPKWALSELPADDVSAILRHELAHLRRYDDWTNLAQKIVKAAFFFHPAVWFVEARLSLEREMACDDEVLTGNIAPRAYAEALVNLAERSFLRRGVQLAQAAVGHVRQLKLRIIKILSSGGRREGSLKLGRFAGAGLFLAALVTLAGVAHLPQFVGFADRSVENAPAATSATTALLSGVAPHPLNISYLDHQATPRGQGLDHARIKHHDACRFAREQVTQSVPVEAELTENPAFTKDVYPAEILAPVVLVVHGNTSRADGVVVWHLIVLHMSPVQQAILIGGVPHQI